MLTIELDPELRIEKNDGRHEFAGRDKAIKFGRNVASDIRFPADERRVGREHFELRPAAGSYEIVTNRRNPVFVDGERVVETLMLLPQTEIRLIDPKTGPRIHVMITQDDECLGPTTTVHVSDGGTHQGGMKHLRRALAALAVVGIIGGGVLGYQSWQQQQVLAAFADETKTLVAKLDEKPAATVPANWAKVYDKVKGSVYQIAIQKNDGSAPDPMATAWVIGAHTLVTNSHAAKLYDPQGKTRLVVIAPDGKQSAVRIIAAPRLHPAYDRFRQVVDEAQKSGTVKIGQVGSYDVAFLEVDESVGLGAPLEIARELAIGQQVGLIGFPSAQARNETASQFRVGYVSGTTDFLGIAQGTAGELVYHTASGSGGASGSPIFNDEGKVVAVFSGGETMKEGTANIISGAGTFYAQSAALIDDLTTPWSEEKTKAAIARWKSEALYLSSKDTVWAMLREYGNPERLDRKDFPPAFEKQGTLGKDGTAQFVAVDLEPGTYIAFVSRGKDLRLRAMVDGSAIQSPLYVDAMPTAIFTSGKGTASFVLTGAADTPYWLQLHRFDDEEEEAVANTQ